MMPRHKGRTLSWLEVRWGTAVLWESTRANSCSRTVEKTNYTEVQKNRGTKEEEQSEHLGPFQLQ